MIIYFKSFDPLQRERVRFVTCDMYSGFINSAGQYLPNAKICIDKFHVVRLITEAFQAVRRRSEDIVDQHQKGPLKRAWKLLLKHDSDLTDKARHVVRSVLTTAELRLVYDLLQDFYAATEESSFAALRVLLTDWICAAINSEIPEMATAACSIRHWKGYVLNGFKYHKTNAIAEGINNRIKALKRVSFGFHNFETMRRRCLAAFGPTRPEPCSIKLYRPEADHIDCGKNG